MFLKCTRRHKDGKTHCYWSVVENRRLSTGRITQRQVLYLGEINDSQKAAWRKSIEVFDEGRPRQVALFPEALVPPDTATAVGIKINELQLKRPRQMGRLLARRRAVAAARTRCLLGSPSATLP